VKIVATPEPWATAMTACGLVGPEHLPMERRGLLPLVGVAYGSPLPGIALELYEGVRHP